MTFLVSLMKWPRHETYIAVSIQQLIIDQSNETVLSTAEYYNVNVVSLLPGVITTSL